MSATARQASLFADAPLKADGKAGGLRAPFPAFGGKSGIAALVWHAFGDAKQYIEPFMFSGAVLLANPRGPASLEVAGDINGYVANFWRAVKCQPDRAWQEADYPVSHIDLAARHRWLVEPDRVAALAAQLADPAWPGDARIAGWWAWGQCCWIGSGWCEPPREGKIPHVSSAGRGIQAQGQIPHVSSAGMGIQAQGQIPHVSDAGRGAQSPTDGELLTPYQGRAREWIRALSVRLARVRLIHGEWTRCLNHHYGGANTAIFLDPPYRSFEALYGPQRPVAEAVAEWCREHQSEAKIALCGHAGDYDLPAWEVVAWDRGRLTYGGAKTTASEAIWFSPTCRRINR